MNSATHLRKKAAYYAQSIKANDAILSTMPKRGNFCIFSDKGSYRYRVTFGYDENGKLDYTDIHDDNIAADYAFRTYLNKLNEDYKNELNAINAYLAEHKDIKSGHLDYKYQDEYNRLIRKRIGSPNEELQNKLNNMFTPSTHKLKGRSVLTLRGERVRSKSEAIIADELFKRGIPYVYEPIVEINGIEYMPDFILADPETGTLYMWEHLGLMDKNDYACRAFDKFKQYQLEGWTLGINLITTSETREFPFTGQNASAAIDYYL